MPVLIVVHIYTCCVYELFVLLSHSIDYLNFFVFLPLPLYGE